MQWKSLQKPAEITETRLIDAIMAGHFPIDSHLPAERELAVMLGVTRPTLREALQRLARDGWVEIHQGRPTRVRDYWHEGNLGVLGSIARRSNHLPPDFVSNLLSVRLVLAPEYTKLAVENSPDKVLDHLTRHTDIHEDPESFTAFDWDLHLQLTIASGNPIFTLILNGFSDLYLPMANRYFQLPASRSSSRSFYTELNAAALNRDPIAAHRITQRVMAESLELWQGISE